MERLRDSSHNEVVFEFLRNEFHKGEFAALDPTVRQALARKDFSPACAHWRRVLIGSVHQHFREIPRRTAWSVVRLQPADVDRIYAYPRGQWRSISGKQFPRVADVAHAIAAGAYPRADTEHVRTIQHMAEMLKKAACTDEGFWHGAVIVLGERPDGRLVIGEGNHRLAAAVLSGRPIEELPFLVLCGLSRFMKLYWIYHGNPLSYLLHARVRAWDLVRRQNALAPPAVKGEATAA